jgi:hypothetical protein
MGNPQTDQLSDRLYAFLMKVLNDPASPSSQGRELQMISSALMAIARALPGVNLLQADQVQAFFRDLTTNPRLREAVKTTIKATANNPISNVPEPPQIPGPNATSQEMMRYQQEMAKYAQMMQLLSNVLRQMNENQKAALRNLR